MSNQIRMIDSGLYVRTFTGPFSHRDETHTSCHDPQTNWHDATQLEIETSAFGLNKSVENMYEERVKG